MKRSITNTISLLLFSYIIVYIFLYTLHYIKVHFSETDITPEYPNNNKALIIEKPKRLARTREICYRDFTPDEANRLVDKCYSEGNKINFNNYIFECWEGDAYMPGSRIAWEYSVYESMMQDIYEETGTYE